MPQRSNIVGDLGTTKIASDSYDVDNIYLSEEGWVYRHFKSTDQSRWWDEIIVAGEVPSTDSPEATNPPKLGTVASPSYETGDGTFDYEYSSHQQTGTPGTDTDKIVTEGGGLGVGDGAAPAFTIGNVFNGGNVSIGAYVSYRVGVQNDGNADDLTYAWAITGGTADPSTGSFADATASSTDFTPTAGGSTYELTCTISSVKAGGAGGDGTGSKTSKLTITTF